MAQRDAAFGGTQRIGGRLPLLEGPERGPGEQRPAVTAPEGPLAGVRVLDMTHVLAGPFAAELLGDLGADVIKVEPFDGDMSRSIGPRRTSAMSAQFVSLNRNKRAIAIDLKRPQARELFERLVKTSQVLVTNMRPSALERLQADYATLSAIVPDIVYCRITGFGAEHPDRDKPAIDDVIQARSGLVSLQGQLTGSPSFVALPLADTTAATFAALGIVAALYRRALTGRGEEIEVPLYDAMVSLLMTVHMSGSVFEPPLGPPVYARSVTPTRRPFRTADGTLCAAPYSDRDWSQFLALVDMQDLLEDPRFESVYARSQNLHELYSIIEPVFLTRTTGEWIEALAVADVPAGPVATTAEAVADPALAALFPVIEESSGGRFRQVRNPIRYTESSAAAVRRPAPRLGEHSTEILTELGYDGTQIEELTAENIVLADPHPTPLGVSDA